MSEKLSKITINLSHQIQHEMEADEDGYYVSYTGKAEERDVIDDMEATIDVYLSEETNLSSDEIKKVINNLEIKVSTDIHEDPLCRDVFSPSLGHGTVSDGVEVTEYVEIVVTIKDQNENNLTKEDGETIAEIFSGNEGGVFRDLIGKMESTVETTTPPEPKKRPRRRM